MNWFSDNWKILFDGVGGAALLSVFGFLLKHWFGSRKKSTGEQTKATVKAENSSLVNSPIAGGSQNNQTVNAHTITAGTLNITTAMSGTPRIFVVGIALGVVVIVVLGFVYTKRMPGANTPVAVRNSHGHPRPGDANGDELAINELQDSISDLIEYKDRVQISAFNRKQLKDAAYLAERMLGFSDANLRLRYRYVKYEYAAFALEMAAIFVMPDDRATAAEYAANAIKTAGTALALLKQAEGAYPVDEESRVLLDWVNKEDSGKDRVLYIKADAACLLGKVKDDSNLKSQALETWNQIGRIYRADFPAKGTPELSGCVPITKSD